MKFFLIFSLLISTSLFGQQTVGEKRLELIELIDEELKEVTRLSRQKNHRSPVLLLRVAELNLEKARLLKEVESAKYLRVSPKKRNESLKRKYFSGSKKLFEKAQKVSFLILQRFKNFKGKSDVYYILAFNAKEFQQYAKAKKYFQLANRYSKKNTKTNLRSKLALAELLFNESKFREAIPIYEQTLKVVQDKWWTKDALNLSWSYYQVKKTNEAIKLARKVYRLSKSKKYVDKSDIAMSHLTLFYAESGKISEAVKFFNNERIEALSIMSKLGKNLLDKGKPTMAQKVFKEALKLTKSRQQKIDIYSMLLGIYDKYGNDREHYQICKELVDFHHEKSLSESELDNLNYNIKNKAAILQRQVSSETYKNVKKVRKSKAEYAVKYFNLQNKLNGSNDYKILFHTAETQYAVNKFSEAIENYDKAYLGAQKKKDFKIQSQSLKGMLSALGQKGLKKSTKDKYLMLAYQRVLRSERKTKRAYIVYQKLFQIYFDQQKIQEAENTIHAFKKSFPRDMKTQEAMIAKILEYHNKNKNRSEILKWANYLKDGKYKVSRNLSKRIGLLLLTLQFDKVEKFTSEGQKKNALQGYYLIYKDKTSSRQAKTNSSYNIAILFYELGKVDEAFKWIMIAMKLMIGKDFQKHRKDVFTLSKEMFNRRKIEKSYQISFYSLDKFCKYMGASLSSFFNQAYVLQLAEKNISELNRTITLGRRCKVKFNDVKKANLDLLQLLIDDGNITRFENQLNLLEQDRRYWASLISPIYAVYTKNSSNLSGGDKLKYFNKMINFYNYAKQRKIKIDLEALDAIAQLKLNQSVPVIAQLNKTKLIFPEKIYNARLANKLKLLDQLTSKLIKVLQVGSGKGIVKSYQYLIESYQRVVAEIDSFIPPNKPTTYIKTFKKDMRRITKPLLAKSKDFLREGRRQIKRNNILSKDNYWFFSKTRVPVLLEYEYHKSSLIMDRGGVK